MESIDALAKAVNEFDGGLVLVSHDMRLISQVAKEIWICDNKVRLQTIVGDVLAFDLNFLQTIKMYKGDINSFKMDMRAQMNLEDEAKGGSKQSKGKLKGDASVMKKTSEELAREAKAKAAKENAKSGGTSNGGSRKSSLDSLLAPKPRGVKEGRDVFDMEEVKKDVPAAEPVRPEPQAAPAKARYIPPHLRNRQ